MTDPRELEFSRRVAERLAEWAAEYARMGAESASPLMDQIVAEEQVMREMKAEGRWPTRSAYDGIRLGEQTSDSTTDAEASERDG